MILEILKFCTRDFWTFAAVAFLLAMALSAVVRLTFGITSMLTGRPMPKDEDE